MKFVGLLAFIPVCLLGQETLTQEGAFWVHTMSGLPSIPAHSRLMVSARGTVIIRGVDGQASFRVTQRVRSHSAAEAQRLFGQVNVLNQTTGGFIHFDVTPSFSPMVSTQVELNVPKQLASLTVETLMGSVDATDLDSIVDVSTAAGPIHVDRVRGAVVARTGGGDIRIGKIGSALRCVTGGGAIVIENAGGEVSCETAGGDIEVKESGSKLALSTEGGNISVDKAGGSVDAHSAEGVIEVAHAAGIVTAATRGGSIQIGSAKGVKAESAAGQVRLKGSSGPLRVSTAAGSILAELFSGLPFEDSSLISGAGDITVLIPSNFPLSITATNQSSNGKRGIVSDFSEVRVRNTGFFQAPMLAEGSINGGGPMLTLNVAGGVIYLRKK